MYFPNIQAPEIPDSAYIYPKGLCVGIPPQNIQDPYVALSQLAPNRTNNSTIVSAAGVTPEQKARAEYEADRLALPYFNWGAGNYTSNISGYMPMVYADSEKEITNVPQHKVWLLINEPDIGGQANQTPDDTKAQINYAISVGIKKWIGPNVAFVSDKWGYNWLQRYLQLNGPIPNRWGIHIYPTGFSDELDAFDYEYEQLYELLVRFNSLRPIVITETNAGESDPEKQVRYMQGVMERIEVYEELEAAFWFSAYYSRMMNNNKFIYHSNLLDEQYKRNYIGDAFREIVDK